MVASIFVIVNWKIEIRKIIEIHGLIDSLLSTIDYDATIQRCNASRKNYLFLTKICLNVLMKYVRLKKPSCFLKNL
jgi:hypothetical protein